MNDYDVRIDLIADWHRKVYDWFVSNCGTGEWKFTSEKNDQLAEAVARKDIASVSETDRYSLASYYFNLIHRIVAPLVRKFKAPPDDVLFSNVPADQLGEVKKGFDAFRHDVLTGNSLEQRQTEKRFEIDGKDVLLDRFKIQHFHVRANPKNRGNLVAYCFVSDEEVKVIALETHKAFSSPEMCQAIVEKAFSLYPEEFKSFMVKEDKTSIPTDLAEQKKLAWLNVNASFWIGEKEFYPIGMGSMMDGVSMESQRWMMMTVRLLRAATRAIKKVVQDNREEIVRIDPRRADGVEFRLFGWSGPMAEARSSDESWRTTYDIISNKVNLSCVDKLLSQKVRGALNGCER